MHPEVTDTVPYLLPRSTGSNGLEVLLTLPQRSDHVLYNLTTPRIIYLAGAGDKAPFDS